MKKYVISAEEYQAVIKAMKVNRDKLIDRRLRVLKYRYEGLSDQKIAEDYRLSRKANQPDLQRV